MTAPQTERSWPWPANAGDWPGRPVVDIPGLEEPARYCHAVATLDELGHRQFLVIASEDGSMPTIDQLGALADGLDELFGEDPAEGSRAWLTRRLHETEHLLRGVEVTLDGVRRRAELAETALRERSDLDDQAARIEKLTFELDRARDAHARQAERAAQLHAEREEARADLVDLGQRLAARVEENERLRNELHQAKAAAAELQPSAPVEVLRREVEDQTRRAENAETRLRQVRSELAVVQQDSDAAYRGVDQLAAQVDALYDELDDAHALADETRDALIESVRHAARADHGERKALREAATQARRARSAVAGAAGALLSAAATAAALAWRHRR